MRLLHTSDWHLGRSFGPVSLHDDQCQFVDWFVSTATRQKVNLVVIAGDVYDRAVPPTRCLDLVRSALVRLQRAGIVTVVITGNHDGAERVAAYDGLIDAAGVHIRGGYSRAGEVLRLAFADGPLDVVAVPYLDPVLAPAEPVDRSDPDPIAEHADDPVQEPVLHPAVEPFLEPVVGAPAAHRRPTHHRVMARAIAQARRRGIGTRSLAVAHGLVVGGNVAAVTSSSERELTVGGTGAVDASLFSEFSYTALGHLHTPQAVGVPYVRYSGSPLAYSFSETRPKEVLLVDIDGAGEVIVEPVAVPIGRGVITLTGSIDELVGRPDVGAVDRFVRVVLTDPGAVIDAKARLQAAYPLVVEIELRPLRTGGPEQVVAVHHRRRLGPAEATAAFWRDVHAESPTAAQHELIVRGLDEAAGVLAASSGSVARREGS